MRNHFFKWRGHFGGCWLGLLGVVCSLAILVGAGAGAEEQQQVVCGHAHAWADEWAEAERQYAPDRVVDVQHVQVEVVPDFARREISGETTIEFSPIAKPVHELRLHGVDLTVEQVEASAGVRSYHAGREHIDIWFREAIEAGGKGWVRVKHSAAPRKGLYFRTPELGYAEGETHLFTQGEPMEARHWYPSFDYPNEKFATEMICTVPEGMVALSNGRLVEREVDEAAGVERFHWLQEKAHVNYLVTLVAGYFEKVEDQYGEVTMAFWTPPAEVEQAWNSFEATKAMMAFFEEEIGMDYPWARYDQVVVRDFMWGGMENTAQTTLNERTLFREETENIYSSEGLVAHELAHQWFGNLVTCKDWSQIWLNEGFATYYQQLFAGHAHGREELLYSLYRSRESIVDRSEKDSRPMVIRRYPEADAMFRQLGLFVYRKGAWVLHMLRSQLGEEVYRACVREYLDRHAYESVMTADLISAVEDVSGRTWDRFFDEWVFGGGVPELKVSYEWEEKSQLARVTVRQGQNGGVFHLPLPVRFTVGDEVVDEVLDVTADREDFHVRLAGAPDLVRIDPDVTVLAKIEFSPSVAMLRLQTEKMDDVMGRLLAVGEWKGKGKSNEEAVEQLRERLQGDPFYGVRERAAQALGELGSKKALEALLRSMDQPDARVRLEVVRRLGSFFDSEAGAALQEVLGEEKNPAIVAAALEGLGAYPELLSEEELLEAAGQETYKDEVAQAGVKVLAQRMESEAVPRLMQLIDEREAEWHTTTVAAVLRHLGALGHSLEDKQAVREFLADRTKSGKETIQEGALVGLGSLGDAGAVPVLETFASRKQGDRLRQAAEEALGKVRAGAEAGTRFREVHRVLEEVKKENESLRETVRDLEKRVEAWLEGGREK